LLSVSTRFADVVAFVVKELDLYSSVFSASSV